MDIELELGAEWEDEDEDIDEGDEDQDDEEGFGGMDEQEALILARLRAFDHPLQAFDDDDIASLLGRLDAELEFSNLDDTFDFGIDIDDEDDEDMDDDDDLPELEDIDDDDLPELEENDRNADEDVAEELD